MQLPLVSVVMSVRNGEKNLAKTIDSVLCQEGVELEFIVVNDGSTDDTQVILNELAAKDSRIKLFSWDGIGLTKSLKKACLHANGQYIARQDANDYSLPNRLYTQACFLMRDTNSTMCSTYVRFITEEGVTALTNSLAESQDPKGFTGVIHGSVMFKKSAYQTVGGYREEFYYAQDVDLWTRLLELGTHVIVPEIYYENCLTPCSISGSRKNEQAVFFRFIVEATNARRSGISDKVSLMKALRYSEACQKKSNKPGNPAGGAYFIASCLIKTYPLLAKKYLEMALQTNPFHLRARLKLSQLKCV